MKADAETIARVSQAIERATAASEQAARDFLNSSELKHDAHGQIVDACGYARVHTYDTGTSVTAALRSLGITDRKHGGHYDLKGFFFSPGHFGIREQSITLWGNAAKAAAKVLTEELGQDFIAVVTVD